MTTVLCVPQWQGSGSETAHRLADGARRSAELLPADAVVTVPVRGEGGELTDGVRALDVLVENLRLTHQALASLDDLVITAGGDCGVELAPIAAVLARYGDRLTVLWCDAHPDANTPQTSPSGSFHGMVLRALLGDGHPALVPERSLAPEQVILVGVRAIDPGERDFIDQAGIRRFGVEEADRALDGLSGPVYLHMDLDVLDPQTFSALSYPEPDGLAPHRLIDLVSRLDTVVGASITEHAPSGNAHVARDDDVIRRLGAALIR